MCYTPWLAGVTFLIEVGVIYSIYRNGLRSNAQKLMAITATTLATYQLSEVLMCGFGFMVAGTRLGWFAISLLPPMGLLLLQELGATIRGTTVACATGAGFAAYYAFIPGVVTATSCGRIFIRYANVASGQLYGLYYNGLLLLVSFALAHLLIVKRDHEYRELHKLFLLGYLGFMIPTALIVTFVDGVSGGIPSIMCAFAVSFALALARMDMLYEQLGTPMLANVAVATLG